MRKSEAFGAIFSCGIGLPEPQYAADLKRQCHEIFASGFFHESVFPQPQSILLRPFRISKNSRSYEKKSGL
jgi:hypothetical protein